MAVGGCLFSRTPMALVRELLRQRRHGLTLARNLTCTEGEFLMVAGAAARIVTAWMSIGLPWGVSKILRHFVESGRVALEEWSHLALGLRFRAAAARGQAEVGGRKAHVARRRRRPDQGR